MIDQLTRDDFLPFLTQTFRVALESGKELETTLIEVSPLGPERSSSKGRRAFSVIFQGPADYYLPQRIYTVSHPGLGALDLFLVSIGPDEHGMCYEAVFN